MRKSRFRIAQTQVRRILGYTIGFFAEGGFHDHSDIDLLVYDFKGPYWEMYSEAQKITAPFKVSVVCSEDASPSLIEHVREKGVNCETGGIHARGGQTQTGDRHHEEVSR